MADRTISMFDEVTASNIASYWETREQLEEPYLGEVLFPDAKQESSEVEWYKGKNNAPKPLAPSALDAQAIARPRQGFDGVRQNAIYFKESKYLDEKERIELRNLSASTDKTRADFVLNHIFDDRTDLLRGASLTREIARMSLLTTGAWKVSGNGVAADVDYQMPSNHMGKATGANWKQSGSNPIDDLRAAAYQIGVDTGATITRVVMNRATFLALLNNNTVKSTLLANNANTAAVSIPQSVLTGYLQDELGLAVQVYDKGYYGADGKYKSFIGDGLAILMPNGELGRTVFAATPEETDLSLNSEAQVSIVDTGVAVATYTHKDPVTVETKVSQFFVPTFEQIESVYVLDGFHYSGSSASSGSTSSSTPSSSAPSAGSSTSGK